ncbi:MAG TPA: M15 family metallopeptidase [Pseudonocardiaceae bacterium]|nr:M15 family metallopeptidase [Pseudonocardiaceae bacterium]
MTTRQAGFRGRRLVAALAVLGLGGLGTFGIAACGSTRPAGNSAAGGPSISTTPSPSPASPATSSATRPTIGFSNWKVGAKPLPLRSDGYGEIEPTPAQLVDRRLPTVDFLPPPKDGRFHSTESPVPAAVLARSTWQASCPVTAAQLRYLTMSFWGFDGRPHTGEMIVNAQVASAVPTVFAKLYAAHFPIEEMRVASVADVTAHPTGDGNDTTSFVCRPTVGLTTWSVHAYGLAIDLNPFCNPYREGSLVVPELASAYLNRSNVRPGMVLPGDATVRAFASIGWKWGGSWTSPKDLMHFTATGH